jgi:ATP-binding cassette subfamily D (ALD) long-chain fatty acid import protein
LGPDSNEWEYERIGTEKEKMNVERELQELRGQMAQVEEWKARHQEIEDELAKVWLEGGNHLPTPAYVEEKVVEGDEGLAIPDQPTSET